MKGVDQYNNRYINMTAELIKQSNYGDILIGFKNSAKKLSVSSSYRYINHINNFLNSINYNPKHIITYDEYNYYIASLSQTTPSYQIQVYSALKKFSAYLYNSGREPEYVMKRVERPDDKEREETISKRKKAYLTPEETSQYIGDIKTGTGNSRQKTFMNREKERDLAMIEIFLATGMRCSEMYKLDISNFDLKTRQLKTTAKGNIPRCFTLSEEIIPDILEWLKIRELQLTKQNLQEEAFFISRSGSRLCMQSIVDIVHKYAKNIEGKNITPHKLRATFGTTLLTKTNDIYLTQQALGHANPKTTEIYVKGQEEAVQEKVATVISSLF